MRQECPASEQTDPQLLENTGKLVWPALMSRDNYNKRVSTAVTGQHWTPRWEQTNKQERCWLSLFLHLWKYSALLKDHYHWSLISSILLSLISTFLHQWYSMLSSSFLRTARWWIEFWGIKQTFEIFSFKSFIQMMIWDGKERVMRGL